MTNEELTSRYMELDERVTRHTEQIKTAFNQITELKALAESVKDLALSVQLMAHEQKDIGKKVDGLATDLEEIKEKSKNIAVAVAELEKLIGEVEE